MDGNIWLAACIVLGTICAAATLPGTIELMLLTLGGILPLRATPVPGPGKALHIAAIVPAHNEHTGIQRTVRSLLQCDAGGPFSVIVIADNCEDATAALAESAGARVFVRTDPVLRGKGYALDFAFHKLMPEGIDAFLIVDGDTVVDPGLVADARRLFETGADAVQCRYRVSNVEASLRTRLMNVALLAFNVLRPRGRDRFALSAGILGNGFGLTRETLAAVPYDARSVVEDLEYHLRLVRSGRRVRFVDSSTVWGEMPTGGKGSATQRARWEGGRLRMIGKMTPGLIGDVLRGNGRLWEPLLDLLLLPLAFHVLLLLVGLSTPVAAVRWFAAGGLAVVVGHVLAAVRVGGGVLRDLAAVAAAPVYIVWKIMILGIIARTARHSAEWVRTEREVPSGGK